jgi:Tol biopolymer transport system component
VPTPRPVSIRRWLVALTVGVAGCGADSSTDPGTAARSAEIAFGYSLDAVPGHGKLYLLSADGRMTALFPDVPNASWGPEWSPDGEELAFSRELVLGRDGSGIWFARPDGSGLSALPSPAGAYGLRWSFDGTRVYLVRTDDSGIWSMRRDGTDLQKVPLPFDATYYGSPPSLSRDGRRIAFVRPAGLLMTNVWVADLDGSNLRQVSTGNYDSAPRWSPDGSQIVFVSEQLQADLYRAVIGVVNADGTGERYLTALTTDFSSDRNPIWSPDGQWILYEHTFAPSGGTGRCTIHKLSVAGGAPIDLLGARATGFCLGLSWRAPRSSGG